MQALSKRLSLAAGFVKEGGRVCDVGTDHGYLPLFLYKEGRVKSVCATEVNIKPYQNALKSFEAEGCTDIPLYLCDGLDKVDEGAVDTVIIAGMGGEVISGIIERAKFLKNSEIELILQPMTAAGELRHYLAENGFSVKKEQAVCDGGRVYSVMLACFCGKPYSIDTLRERIGILSPDTADNLIYIKRQEKLCRELCESIKSVPERAELYGKELAALKALEKLTEVK